MSLLKSDTDVVTIQHGINPLYQLEQDLRNRIFAPIGV
jgi:hypothetical protein